MKKLIMIVVTACAISYVHAASCRWTGMNVALQSSADVATAYSVYLLDASVVDASTMAGYLSNGNISFLSSAIVKTTNGIDAGSSMRWAVNGFGDYTAGDTYTYYTVIFNNSVAEASHYMITSEKTLTVPSSGSMQMAFGSQAGNVWVPVPEPTSGLMILLGMTGLALRRKQA